MFVSGLTSRPYAYTSTIKREKLQVVKGYRIKATLTTLQRKGIALFQVLLCLPKHPDSKRELEIRI